MARLNSESDLTELQLTLARSFADRTDRERWNVCEMEVPLTMRVSSYGNTSARKHLVTKMILYLQKCDGSRRVLSNRFHRYYQCIKPRL